MATDYDLRILLAAEDRLSGSLERVQGALGGVVGSINGAAESMAHFVRVALGVYSVYEIIHTLRGALDSVGEAIVSFQDKLVQVQSLRVGQNMVDSFRDIGAAVLETSMLTGRSATELGNALFFIEGHGYKGADALKILEQAAKLAASGLGETDQLVRVVTGQMIAYGASAEEAAHYFDVFARTEQLAALPIGELSTQMARLTPIAAALHIPIEQVGASIATISQTGLNASRVITDLLGVLNQFVKSSPQQQEALKRIGYPIEQLRKDLGEKGVIQTLTELYNRAEGDIDAFGQIFSDRTRALIGFLALMRRGGEDANRVYDEMAQAAGSVERIFAVNQERLSLQWQRFTAIVQATGIVLTQDLLPGIGRAMGDINNALSAGNLVGAWQRVVDLAGSALRGILSVLDDLAREAFGGAYNVAAEIGRGLLQGANDIIQGVVQGIADLIASFLLGASPPPRGPLNAIPQGVAAWQREYARAMESNAGVMGAAAGNVANVVNEQLAKIGAGQGGNTREGLQQAIAGIEQQLLPWQLAADQIKESYNAMLHPLEAQISAIEHIKNLEYERQQLAFEQRDLELRMLRLRAEGDPVRRAQLAGQLARAQELREQHSIEARLATLQREQRNLRPGRGTSPAEIAARRREIQDEINILNIQRQQHRLVNVELLGQYNQKKAQLETDKDIADIANDAFKLQQRMNLQPLIEQRDRIKAQMQSELDYIKQQTDALEDQRKVLQAQLRLLTAGSGGAGGGAGAWKIDTDKIAHEAEKAYQSIIGGMADRLRDRLGNGIREWVRTFGPDIGQGLIGFIAGGMVAGLPGALGGALLAPKIVDEITKRGVQPDDFDRFVTNVRNSLVAAFGQVGARITAGDLLGAASAMADSVTRWINDFQRLFFNEWYVLEQAISDTGGGGLADRIQTVYTRVAAGTPGAVRYTGLGRTIIEALFGPQDRTLNMKIAAELIDANVVQPVQAAIMSSFHSFFAPTVSEVAGGMPMLGPSPFQQTTDSIVAWLRKPFDDAFRQFTQREYIGTGPEGQDLFRPSFLETIPQRITEALRNTPETVLELPNLVLKLGAGLNVRLADEILKLADDPNVLQAASQMGTTLGIALGKALADGLPKLAVTVANLQAAIGLLALNLAVSFTTSFIDEVTKQLGLESTAKKFNDAINKILTPEFKPATAVVTGTGQLALGVLAATPPGAVYMIADWVAKNLPGVLNTITTAVSDFLRPIVQNFQDSFNEVTRGIDANTQEWRTGLNTAMFNIGATIRTSLATYGTLFGNYFDASGASSIARLISGFSVSFTTDVQSWGAQSLWQPMQTQLDTTATKWQKLIDLAREGQKYLAPTPTSIAPPPIREPAPTSTPVPQYYATGGEFTVPGSGGTDSERVAFWASPGERVRVIPPEGNGRAAIEKANRQVNINVTVNGGDPNEVQAAVAAGIREGLGDEYDVPNQLLDAWRTAKGQGFPQPIGVQSRRARG